MTQQSSENLETKYFFELTPERILDAVEASGLRCTGRCLPLYCLENRVYEVELEIDDPSTLNSPSERFRIVKFYRPGRWNQAQLQEEHDFLLDLDKEEVPVAPPEPFASGETLHKLADVDIWYTVFKKVGGRTPYDLEPEELLQVGRLLARMHRIGAVKEAQHRIHLNPEVYGYKNLKYLLDNNLVPLDLQSRYKSAVERICEISTPWFEQSKVQRIHGDAHRGNLLWREGSASWVDFDDMVVGPRVQDLWLLFPGNDPWNRQQRELMIEGYQQMSDFDRQELRLIEPLRALRYLHFSTWIGKRWQDPAFPKVFTTYGTHAYWQEQVRDMEDQLGLVQKVARSEPIY